MFGLIGTALGIGIMARVATGVCYFFLDGTTLGHYLSIQK
ncbi:unnamed protein product [marine sediment metagenome]|uniref:Uncharacterized protein n=1 Tax=marine sediment metagenome TaxID=412755 RepID=X1DYZ7_9ZZZZ